MSGPSPVVDPNDLETAEAEGRRRLDALLERALDLTGDDLSRFLETECPAELRAELGELLALDGPGRTADVERRWTGLWRGVVDAVAEPAAEPAAGDVIGPWRLEEILGRGGMGTVFLAQRCDGQMDMRAALKLCHRPRHDLASRDRFLQERQILAHLQHPSIARLLDGGIADDGRPYFVMEHVVGEPIDLYCDRRQLSVEQRLELFVELVRAVQHAHGQLVVHRDLKPSNILITADGDVKLLDFGIAKLLEEDGVTGDRTATRLLTPEYASPEQFLGKPVGLGTDVYLLGLLLYELLTGRQPQRVDGDTPLGLLRRVCEEAPEPPSRWAAAEGEDGADAPAAQRAADRGTTAPKLERRLRGDLDTIVGKALQKEQPRRYRSVGELADDVERHLAGLPISARPDTLAYRGGKFLRRHAVAAAVAVTTVALVATLVAFYTVRLEGQRSRAVASQLEAERARDQSDAVVGFLVDLFDAADPRRNDGVDATAGELLEQGRERARAELEDQPLVQARLLDSMARIYSSRGELETSDTLLEEALGLRRGVLGPRHPDVAEVIYHQSILAAARGRYALADELSKEALAMLEDTVGPDHPKVALQLGGYGGLLRRLGRLDEAEVALRRAIAIYDASPEETSPNSLAAPSGNLGLLLIVQGRLDEAELHLRRCLELFEAVYGVGHAETADSLANLAIVFILRRDFEQAEATLERSLAIAENALGPDHAAIANIVSNLGEVRLGLGRLDAAATSYQRSLDIFDGALGPGHPRSIPPIEGLARVELARGDGVAAELQIRRAIGIHRSASGERHPDLAAAYIFLGDALRHQDRPAEAESALLTALDLLEGHDGDNLHRRGLARSRLGALDLSQGRPAEALAHLEAAVSLLETGEDGDPGLAEARDLLERARAEEEVPSS
ncbi:MAG: serine/threonine-protein kinase [Acidobacteriota bacterium]